MKRQTYDLSVYTIVGLVVLAGAALGVSMTHLGDKYVNTFVSPNQKTVASVK